MEPEAANNCEIYCSIVYHETFQRNSFVYISSDTLLSLEHAEMESPNDDSTAGFSWTGDRTAGFSWTGDRTTKLVNCIIRSVALIWTLMAAIIVGAATET